MKHKFKRILSLALCFSMTMGLCPVKVKAADDTFSFTISNGTSVIVHTNPEAGCTEANWNGNTTIIPATRTSEGEIHVECENCGKEASRKIPVITPDFYDADKTSVTYDGQEHTVTLTPNSTKTITASDGYSYTAAQLVGNNPITFDKNMVNASTYSLAVYLGAKNANGNNPDYSYNGVSLYHLGDETSASLHSFTIYPKLTTITYPEMDGVDTDEYPARFYGDTISPRATYTDVNGNEQEMDISIYKYWHTDTGWWGGTNGGFNFRDTFPTEVTANIGPGVYWVNAKIPQAVDANGKTYTNYYFKDNGKDVINIPFHVALYPSTLEKVFVNDDASKFILDIGYDDWQFYVRDKNNTKQYVDTSTAGTVDVSLIPCDPAVGGFVVTNVSPGYGELEVVKRQVLSVDEITPITDKFVGTDVDHLGLPETVTIQTEASDGTKTFEDVPVTWDTSGYTSSGLSEQIFSGTLDLSGISGEVENRNNVKARISVSLMNELTTTAPEFPNKTATYTGNPIPHEISGTVTGVASIVYRYSGTTAGGASYGPTNTAPTDVGTYKVTAVFQMEENYAGILPVSSYLYIVKASTTDSTNPPRLDSASTTSITLVDESTPEKPVEYGILGDNGEYTWQDSPTFTGLEPDTEYTFASRYPATDSAEASTPAVSVFSTKAETYTIRYWSNFEENGNSYGSSKDQIVELNRTFVLESNTFTRPGYKFVGWGTSTGATTPAFTDGQSISTSLSPNPNQIVSLFAIWELEPGSINITANKTTATYGDTVVLTANVTHDAPSGEIETTYQWYDNSNNPIAGETNQTMELTDVSDSGTYYCKAVVTDGTTQKTIESNRLTVVIKKATPTFDTDSLPEISDITYGETLASASITNQSDIAGSFTWESANIMPTVADSDVTEYNVVFTPADTANYSATVIPVTIHVDPASLTITAKDTEITFGDEPVTNGVTYSGFVSGEGMDVLSGTLKIECDYEQYQSIPDSGSVEIIPSGLTADNYEITFVNGKMTIHKFNITVTPMPNQSKEFGEEDPSFEYDVDPGVFEGVYIKGNLEREAGEDVGTYDFTLGTLNNKNYNLTLDRAAPKFTINPYDAEVEWEMEDEYIANGTDQSDTIEAYFYNENNSKTELTISIKQNGQETVFKEPGTYIVTAVFEDNNGNYKLSNETLTIEMKSQEHTNLVTFPTASDITFGEPLSKSELTGGNGGGDGNGTYAWEDPDTVPEVGTHTYNVVFTPSNSDTTDYSNEMGYDPETGAVTKTVVVKVNPVDAIDVEGIVITPEKVYDGTAYAAVSASDAINIDPADDVSVTVTAVYDTAGAGEDKTITVTVAITGSDAGKYNIPSSYTVKGSIKKAPLTLKANDAVLEFGDPLIGNGITGTGFVTGESLINLQGNLKFESDYEQYDPIGNYTITPAGVTSGNYDITFEDGALTVGKRAITIAPVSGQQKKIGTADPVLKYTITAGSVSEAAPLVGSLGRESGETIGTYKITLGTLTEENNPNYRITFENGATFEISESGSGGTPTPPGEEPEQQEKLNPPTLMDKTDTTITLTHVPGAEYSKDGGNTWQDSPVFDKLTPDTEYDFVQRKKATDTLPAGPTSNPASFTTNASGDIPTDTTERDNINAPLLSAKTDTTITLLEVAGAEYSKDGGATWQSSPVFSGLTPDTEYTFVQRYKATNDLPAGKTSASATFRTNESGQNTPSSDNRDNITVPELDEKTANSISLKPVDGVEYSKDGGITWQDSPVFDGLTPDTVYTFVQRYKATDTLPAGKTSDPASFRTDKADTTNPTDRNNIQKPEVEDVTDTTVTLKPLPGVEYSKDGGNTWQGSPVFDGLTPDTEYEFVQRYKETDKLPAGKPSDPIKVTTDKANDGSGENQNPSDRDNIAYPALKEATSSSITLVTVTGAEYSKDGGVTWQDSPKFEGLTPDTIYTFVQRYKATNDLPAGKTSEASSFKTTTTGTTNPDTPTGDYAFDYDKETITFDKDKFEVSRDANFSDPSKKVPSGGKVEPGETIYIRPKDDGTGKPGVTSQIKVPERPSISKDIEIDFEDETLNTTKDMEYSTDGGKTWKDCDKNMDISDYIGDDILIRDKATDTNFASKAEKVEIPERPEAPDVDIDFENESIDTSKDMEYSTDNEKTWDPTGKDMDISDLTGDTIHVRDEATSDSFASESTKVEIPERPKAPSITINHEKETINTTKDMEYSTDGGRTWYKCPVNMSVSDFAGKDILVRVSADEDTLASSAATVKVPARPASPVLDWKDTSSKEAADGVIGNTTNKMEFSIDGGLTWMPCPDGDMKNLSSGSYLVRYMATSKTFASNITPVFIGIGNGGGTIGGETGDEGNTGDGNGDNTTGGNGNNTGNNNGNGNNTGNSGAIGDNTGTSGGNTGTTGNGSAGTGSNGNTGSNNNTGSNGNTGSDNNTGSNNNAGSNGNAGSNNNGMNNGTGSDENNTGNDNGNNHNDNLAGGNGFGDVDLSNGKDDISMNEMFGNNGTTSQLSPIINHGAGECPSEYYVDVNQKLWYHDAIDYTAVNGLMVGVGYQEWAPDTQMTRAMACQALYKIVGTTTSYDCTKFSDVTPDNWYYNAVAWADAVGVIKDNDGTFGAREAITYEELAVMIYNLCNAYGLSMVTGTTSTTVTTTPAEEAQAAMTAIAATGIFNVNGSTSVSATGTMTRATAAQVITNFCTTFSAEIGANTNMVGATAGIYTNPGVTNMSGVLFT